MTKHLRDNTDRVTESQPDVVEIHHQARTIRRNWTAAQRRHRREQGRRKTAELLRLITDHCGREALSVVIGAADARVCRGNMERERGGPGGRAVRHFSSVVPACQRPPAGSV